MSHDDDDDGGGALRLDCFGVPLLASFIYMYAFFVVTDSLF
jgi:hypothetical protein